jgi:hypothetical protein
MVVWVPKKKLRGYQKKSCVGTKKTVAWVPKKNNGLCAYQKEKPNSKTPQDMDFYMDDHPMLVELETRCVESDERKQKEAIRYEDLMSRIHAFVDKNSTPEMGEGLARDKMIELVTNLAYLSTLPILKQVPIVIFKSMRSDDPRRLVLLSACAFARGFILNTEITANDSDWGMWIESL